MTMKHVRSSSRINGFCRAAFLALLLTLCRESTLLAQGFSPGNLAIMRLGDGTQLLTNSGNTISLDQYTTKGALVSSQILPDSGPNALLLSGVASSEGGLTRSTDHSVLVIAGYSTN